MRVCSLFWLYCSFFFFFFIVVLIPLLEAVKNPAEFEQQQQPRDLLLENTLTEWFTEARRIEHALRERTPLRPSKTVLQHDDQDIEDAHGDLIAAIEEEIEKCAIEKLAIQPPVTEGDKDKPVAELDSLADAGGGWSLDGERAVSRAGRVSSPAGEDCGIRDFFPTRVPVRRTLERQPSARSLAPCERALLASFVFALRTSPRGTRKEHLHSLAMPCPRARRNNPLVIKNGVPHRQSRFLTT